MVRSTIDHPARSEEQTRTQFSILTGMSRQLETLLRKLPDPTNQLNQRHVLIQDYWCDNLRVG